MEVILLEKVTRLGGMGDVVTVKDGFARNYLIPQGKALRATNENKAEFETRKGEIEKQNQARMSEAQKLAKKLEGTVIELVRQASDDGRLYGSVTVRDIGQFLDDKGFEIPRQNLQLDKTIKEVGSYSVKVMPHPEITLELPVRVARNESEFLTWDEEEKAEAAADAAPQAAPEAAAAEDAAEDAPKKAKKSAKKQDEESDDAGEAA